MVDLNIQVDYDAVIFPVEDDSISPIEPEDQSKIQGESSPSGDFERPRSSEVEQKTAPSAGFKITPSVEDVEETNQHVKDLTKQVDDLKTELQTKNFELHEERDRRVALQAEVKSQQEEIRRLQTMLEKERHLQVKREQVSCSSKVTVDKSVLQQLEYFKREAAKYASRNKGLIEVMVEEYRVRLKYEEQLKSHSEQASKFKAQEEMVKALQGQVADLKVELKLALENNHPRVSTQPEVPLQREGSLQTEETKDRQTSNQPGRSEERQTLNQPERSEERQTSNQPGRSEERQTLNQRGVSMHSLAQPLRQPTLRLQTEESTQSQTSTQTWRSEERQTSMRSTSTGCMEGLHVGVGTKAKLSPARPLHRPTPRWH
ncbi:coiled-coil domain-containing protein 157-like [Poecilia latipinna]|uniref:coiled-coil domain-containing protein 157-like n=1 Tax=Poecilia latipinna TaxID=48699 RepID=UPI00072ED1F2|nr:PREDICTED: coiled-coil domain-containing protein 157-like [Poecilia latipinna]